MIEYGVEPITAEPLLFVFSQIFTNASRGCFERLLNDLEDNFDAHLNSSWVEYWLKHGEHISLIVWKLKYENYLENGTTNKEETNELKELSSISNQSVDQFTEIKQTDLTNDAQGWQELWEAHVNETYQNTYNLYTHIYYDYFANLTKSTDTTAAGTEIEPVREAEYLAEELEQLQLLGLPTSFVGRTQRKRTKKAINEINFNNSYSEDDSSEEIEGDKEEVAKEEEENSNIIENSRHLSDLSEMDPSLHAVQNKIISKRKKKQNRKLRNVPDYLLEEKGMLRYWHKRYSLFSLFDDGIRLDRESWFSVTPEKVAVHMAERLSCDVLVDGFCGCGGNAIQFAKTCRQVIAIDIDPLKVEMAKHNARIYGVAHKIDFIVGDFLQLSRTSHLRAEVVFLSPPWGGPKYKKKEDYDIEKFLLPTGATELMVCARQISENVALFLPRNSNMEQIIKLAGVGKRCEVEHNYLDTRLVGVTALYGEKILS